MFRVISILMFISTLGLLPSTAMALDSDEFSSEFYLGIGYAHVKIGDEGSVLDSEDLIRFDGGFTINPFQRVPQLRLGFGLGVGMDLDDSKSVVIVRNGQLLAFSSSDIPLLLIEPEFRVSWQQWFGKWYIEPGIGVGGVFANLSLESDDGTETFDEWDSSFSGRAFVHVGFAVQGGLAGLQASYMRAGDISFADNAGGEVEEFYIGFFGALQF
jgi:hypothetical protein